MFYKCTWLFYLHFERRWHAEKKGNLSLHLSEWLLVDLCYSGYLLTFCYRAEYLETLPLPKHHGSMVHTEMLHLLLICAHYNETKNVLPLWIMAITDASTSLEIITPIYLLVSPRPGFFPECKLTDSSACIKYGSAGKAEALSLVWTKQKLYLLEGGSTLIKWRLSSDCWNEA